jgi:ABC-type polysaccharide/polyol phosphate transport system ATPase subunit
VTIRAEGLGKMYHLYNSPRDRLKQAFLWGRKKLYREFWALRDVSLEVRRGETVGVIGRNGSGKSTLLQMLAGVLRPTTGSLHVAGRIGALLELGSGFNPDYTGRENVFLNGAILGLSRAEMERRFDEVVSFADIGQFIDQPVKTYSSGMFVRLAFAVTTCVDADVLLIDEALAVGDVFFRQKCYRRLEELRERGASIVLVSHAMGDVEQFCRRGVLLHRGNVAFEGPAVEAVRRYYLVAQEEREHAMAASAASSPVSSASAPAAPSPQIGEIDDWPAADAFLDLAGITQVSNGWARCTAVAMCDDRHQPRRVFRQGQLARFFFEFELTRDIEVPICGVLLQSDKGVVVHGKNTLQHGTAVPRTVAAGSRLRMRQEMALEVQIGEYTFEVGLAALSRADYEAREGLSHDELHGRTVRICHVKAGSFAVTLGNEQGQRHVLHHGVANLPGGATMGVLAPRR